MAFSLAMTPSAGGFGRYLLRERLVATATFEVFRAVLRDAPTGRSYSLKRMLPTSGEGSVLTRQLAGVGRRLTTLAHANLVQVVDCGQIDGAVYIVTELVDGLDLGRWRKLGRDQGVRVDLAATLYTIAQVARGLGHGHASSGEGAVHGHLSPSSILIARDGDVKLTGFGLAATSMDKTDPCQPALELGYFAPEQLAGERADARSDVFSLGLIAYELLTGALPFDVTDPVALARDVMERDIPKPSTKLKGLPADVDQVVCAMLARDRSLRYQSASDVARDLEQVLAQWSIRFDRAQLADFLTRIRTEASSSSATLTALTPEPEPEALPPPPKQRLVDSDADLPALGFVSVDMEPIELTPAMRISVPTSAKMAPVPAARRLPRGLAALILVAVGLWTSAIVSLVSARRLPKPATATTSATMTTATPMTKSSAFVVQTQKK